MHDCSWKSHRAAYLPDNHNRSTSLSKQKKTVRGILNWKTAYPSMGGEHLTKLTDH